MLPLQSQFSFFYFEGKKKNICFKLIQEFPLAVILLVEHQSHAPNIPTLIKSLVSFLEESQVFKSKQMASYLLHTLCHRYSTTPHHPTTKHSTTLLFQPSPTPCPKRLTRTRLACVFSGACMI